MSKAGKLAARTLVLAAGIAIVIGSSYLCRLVVIPLLPFELPELAKSIITQMAVPYGVALPLSLLLFRTLSTSRPEQPRKLGAGGVLGCVAVQTGFAMPLVFVLNIILMLSGVGVRQSTMDMTSTYSLFLLLVFNPIFEELLFRKLTIDRLRGFGMPAAAIISAVLFAIPHVISQGPSAMLLTFVDGLVWGWVYYRTGRLLPCSILHSAGNLLCAVLPTFLMAAPAGMAVYFLIYYLAAPVTAAVVFARFVKNEKKEAK